ncbi:MAG: hypothetical protein M1817_003783 [Caeruleum heppii]|nr:MAG: hypothetical protein M1817_003783 [Caeruleum heppii]
MPPKNASNPLLKRKQPPASDAHAPAGSSTRRDQKRAKTRDARQIAVQTSDKALRDGELDVEKFVKAREWEIRALEASMRGSKDNTPTVTPKSSTKTSRTHLRLDTAKRLHGLAVQARAKRKKAKKSIPLDPQDMVMMSARKPRPKKPTTPGNLSGPPKPSPKYRKRQLHKTWLPTHLFHAKRARMTAPKEPLWRFAIPLTPTEKSYRPTHRASQMRGAVAWDASYMSTIGLEGTDESLLAILKRLGLGAGSDGASTPGREEIKWRDGRRAWEGWLFRTDEWPLQAIAPVVMIWGAQTQSREDFQMVGNEPITDRPRARSSRRRILIRVHPSAFLQLWNECVPLCKGQHPAVLIEDLRFEMGSIEVMGPGSTEALLGILRPSRLSSTSTYSSSLDVMDSTWTKLTGVTNPAGLPPNSVLTFSISDPRLRRPPRTTPRSPAVEDEKAVLEVLSNWPPDRNQIEPREAPAIFSRDARMKAGRQMPSQKAINRRKSLAMPGAHPDPLPSDPQIPVLVLASRPSPKSQGSWTVLVPWKCVLPVWYMLMHYPLSSGGRVRFGGLNERRQVTCESEAAWFPGDFPGTKAGNEWEELEREKRKAEWIKRPRGKRTEWNSVQVKEGQRGEIGAGWACDWDRLARGSNPERGTGSSKDDGAAGVEVKKLADDPTARAEGFEHLPSIIAKEILAGSSKQLPSSLGSISLSSALVTVKIRILQRGVTTVCARLYRLPSQDASLRSRWLDLISPSKQQRQPNGTRLSTVSKADPVQRRRALAASLLEPPRRREGPPQAGDQDYPPVPDEEDLIGFVTTDNHSLGQSKGMGFGSIVLGRVMGKGKRERLCIIREAGQALGRLARWELI